MSGGAEGDVVRGDGERERRHVSSWARVAMLAAVLATSAVLHASGLSEISFHTKGEPREAVAVQDLVQSDRVVLPLRNAYEMPRKPPLFYWLGGAVAGWTEVVDERTVRLPSALQSGVAALLLLAACWARGRDLQGFLAAMVLLTTFEWSRSATSARIDMTLALGTTASLVGLTLLDHPRRTLGLVLLYGGMIWGTLAKGPIGIILPTLCILVLALVDAGRRWLLAGVAVVLAAAAARAFEVPTAWILPVVALAAAIIGSGVGVAGLRRFQPLLGYPVVGAVVVAWYALAARSIGPEFVEVQILAENFGRFFGTAQLAVGHEHGPGYLFGALAGGFMPWTLFLPGVVTMLASGSRRTAGALYLHAVVWIVVVFGFFTLSSSKRGVYLLPLYPAASLLVAGWLVDLLAVARARPVLRRTARGLGLVGAGFAGSLAAFFLLQDLGVDLLRILVEPIVAAEAPLLAGGLVEGLADRAALLATLCGMAALAAYAVAVLAESQNWPGFVALLFGTIFAVLLVAQRAALPAAAQANSRESMVTRVRSVASAREISTAPVFDYGFAYYMGGAVPVVDLAQADASDSVTVLPLRTWRGLPMEVRERYEPIPPLGMAKQSNQAEQITVQRRLASPPAAR